MWNIIPAGVAGVIFEAANAKAEKQRRKILRAKILSKCKHCLDTGKIQPSPNGKVFNCPYC